MDLKIKKEKNGLWCVKVMDDGDVTCAVTELDCYANAKAYLRYQIQHHEVLMNLAKRQYSQLIEDNK